MNATTGTRPSTARAVADLEAGLILASVELAAAPGRVFQALISDEVLDWWVRPGVFDTREWSADARPAGCWRAAGMGRGQPYVLEGEFVTVAVPHTLVHTWRVAQEPATTTVSYRLADLASGTRLTLRHCGFTVAPVCLNTCIGWETSFERLEELLAAIAHS